MQSAMDVARAVTSFVFRRGGYSLGGGAWLGLSCWLVAREEW